MARKPRPLTPAGRRLRDETSKTLAAAVKLDQIEPGAGDGLRESAATALATVRARAVRKEESGMRSESNLTAY